MKKKKIDDLNRKPAQTIEKRELVKGLRRVGLTAGHKIVVHSSLSSFGHVEGGADVVIDALEEVVTTNGTIVYPTFSGQLIYFLEALSLKAGLHLPKGNGEGVAFSGPLVELWHTIRQLAEEAGIVTPFTSQEMIQDRVAGEKEKLKKWGFTFQAGDAMGSRWIGVRRDAPPLPKSDVVPWKMPVNVGAIPDRAWRRFNTTRSQQYSGSFAVWGKGANSLLKGHDNSPGQTEEMHPLFRMKQSGGKVLLLGVDHGANSSIHVAQWFAVRNAGVMLPDETKEFMNNFQDVDVPIDARSGQKHAKVGNAHVRLVDMEPLFDVVSDLLKTYMERE